MLARGQFKCSDRAILSLRIWLGLALKDLLKTFPNVNFFVTSNWIFRRLSKFFCDRLKCKPSGNGKYNGDSRLPLQDLITDKENSNFLKYCKRFSLHPFYLVVFNYVSK